MAKKSSDCRANHQNPTESLQPFHFVVTLQRELAEGKHSAIFKLLRRDKDAVPARHAIYLRIWLVLITLALQVYLIWWMQFNFTNKLPPGNYRAFYVTVSQTTWFVYFVLGTSWMIWYYRMINELKRECLIAEAFLPQMKKMKNVASRFG